MDSKILNLKIPTMLTIKETAQETGMAEHFIRSLVLKNEIVHVKAGKKYLINLEKLIDYLNTANTNKKDWRPCECVDSGGDFNTNKYKIKPVKEVLK